MTPGKRHQECAHRRTNCDLTVVAREKNDSFVIDTHARSDKYQIMDAIEFMRSFKTGTVRGVITSPPYNKRFRHRGRKSSNWPT